MAAKKDLTGRRIGILTVVARCETKTERRGFAAQDYLCRCDCGNERIFPSYELTPSRQRQGCGRECRLGRGGPHGKLIAYEGKSQTISQWSEELGIPVKTLAGRAAAGKDLRAGRQRFGPDKIDLTGKKFDWLEVIGPTSEVVTSPTNGKAYSVWLCRCRCGKEKKVPRYLLHPSSSIKSCGCRPNSGSRMLTHDGRTQSLARWSRETGISSGTITARLRHGWSVDAALSVADGRQNPFNLRTRKPEPKVRFRGRTLTLSQWAEETGIPFHVLVSRHYNGWPPARMLTTKPGRHAEQQTLTFEGRTMTYRQWAEEYGTRDGRIRGRILKGWTVREALTGIREKK